MEYEKGKTVTLEWRKVNITSDVTWIWCTPHMMWWKGHFTSVAVFIKTSISSLILRKTTDPDWGYSEGYLAGSVKTVKFLQDKERLKNCHKPERHDKLMQYATLNGRILEQKNDINGKKGEIYKWSQGFLIPMSFS